MMTRSLRHRFARRGASRYVWCPVSIIDPYVDRLRAAAIEPCWRTTTEGRAYVAKLERVMPVVVPAQIGPGRGEQ